MQKVTYINKYNQSITFSSKNKEFTLLSIDGSSLGTNAITSKAISQDGITTEEITLNNRTVICEFSISGKDSGIYNKAKLYQKWQEITSIILLNSFGTLIYENEKGKYKIRCRPVEIPSFQKISKGIKKFKIDFVSDSPFWQSFETISKKIIFPIGGLSFPCIFPYQLSTLQNQLTINNTSNIDIDFVIRAYVPAGEKFVFQNVITGEKIEFEKALKNDIDFLYDTSTCTAYKIDGNNKVILNDLLSTDTNFDMKLHSGENILTASNSSTLIEYNYNFWAV